MHDLMYQRPAAGRNVHDQRFVFVRVVPIGRGWLVPEQETSMFLIRLGILKKPDVENLLRVAREEVSFEPVNCPFDGFNSMFLHDNSGFVTNHDERPLNNNRELRRRQCLLILIKMSAQKKCCGSAWGLVLNP